MIKNWKPWERSTGPKTPEGREVCKLNAKKHGARGGNWNLLKKILREQNKFLEDL